jgi:hypothetical protein
METDNGYNEGLISINFSPNPIPMEGHLVTIPAAQAPIPQSSSTKFSQRIPYAEIMEAAQQKTLVSRVMVAMIQSPGAAPTAGSFTVTRSFSKHQMSLDRALKAHIGQNFEYPGSVVNTTGNRTSNKNY